VKTPPPIIPAKKRIRRKRRVPPPPLTPPPLGVTVVNAVWLDEQHAQWNFSAPVLSIEDAGGLLIGGQEPDTADLNADGVLCSYTSGVSIDDPWEVDAFPLVVLTFDGGGTLVVPESGNVV